MVSIALNGYGLHCYDVVSLVMMSDGMPHREENCQ